MSKYILLKNLEYKKINEYIKTLNRISTAFAKLSEDVGNNQKNVCNSIVLECDEISNFLNKIVEKL
jgi:hypothetical protein